MGHRPPRIEQLFPAPFGQHAALPAHADARRAGGACNALRAFGQCVALDQVGERGAVFAGDLHHCAQFFVEQAAERIVAPCIQRDIQALPRRKRHLAQRSKRTAIAAIVIRQQQPAVARVANQFEEAAQPLRIVQIRHLAAERRQRGVVGIHLRQHRPAQPLLAASQPDQPQLALFTAAQQRRQLRAHIANRGERTDDQRDRRNAFQRFTGNREWRIGNGGSGGLRRFTIPDSRFPIPDLPLRLHRQRILAHRHAQFECRAQLHADRAHGVVQQRVFAAMAGGGHPVGRELDAVQRLHRCGAQVGDRFAHGHARRCGGIQQRQRRALADRHRFAFEGIETGQRDRAIGQRQLPRTDHLFACGQTANAAIADGDQKALGRHGGMRQHAQARLLQVQRRGLQHRPLRRTRMRRIAMHLRRLAEQHVHGQIDRELGIASREWGMV